MHTRKLPSAWWYILPSILLIIGIGLIFYFVISVISNTDKGEGFIVPGSYELSIEEPGTYTIFHEYRTNIDGKYYETDEEISGLSLVLENEADGSMIELSSSGNSQYGNNGREGVSIASFRAKEPGTYILSAQYEDGQGPDVVLTISKDFVKSLLFGIGSVIAGIGFIVLSFISFIVVLLLRITRKNQTPAAI